MLQGRIVAVVMVLVAGSSYGIVSTLMKLAYSHGLTVTSLTNLQFIVATIILWVLTAISRFVRQSARPVSCHLRRSQFGLLVALGISGAVTSLCYYAALRSLSASMGIILLFQFTWMVAVIEAVVKRRLPSARKWSGLLIIVIGTVLAVGVGGGASLRGSLPAVALGLLSAAAYAATLYLSGYADTAASPTYRSAIANTISTVLLMCFFPPTRLWSGQSLGPLIGWGTLVALFSQVIPLTMLLAGTPRIGGRMAGVLGSIELPIAVLAAFTILREPIPAIRWIGVALILLGILWSEWPRRAVEKGPATKGPATA